MTKLKKLNLFAFLLFVALGLIERSDAQDDVGSNTKFEMPDVEMLECKVKVVDPDGFPVEDATVFCTGLRSRETPGSHLIMDWLMKVRIKTNENGIAVMPYPKSCGKGNTTGTMTWSVLHPDFTSYRKDHSIDDDPAEIILKRGFRIALTAKRASGEKLTENLHAVVSFDGGGKWDLKTNGMLVSNTMKKQEGVLRVVCFEPGKPTLFSKEIEVKPGEKSRVLLQGVELTAGCRVEGKLAESIERPVENGYVIARVKKKASLTDRFATWHWSDEAKIDPDGTFVFESLPPGEVIQMIPICDGWVPAKPDAAEVFALLPVGNDLKFIANKINQYEATPQVIKADGKLTTATLRMVPGPTINIEVVDQAGKPLEGVALGTSPNQYWFNSGSDLLGESISTREAWGLSMRGEDAWAKYFSEPNPYQNETDVNGLAVFKSMPQGTHDFYVGKKGWEMAKESETGERTSMRVTIEGEDQTIKITMQPKQDSDAKPEATEKK